MPATEWMRVASSASSKVMSGRIVGTQRAISVLPLPGGPINSTLCPPAAAISRARLARLCAEKKIMLGTDSVFKWMEDFPAAAQGDLMQPELF